MWTARWQRPCGISRRLEVRDGHGFVPAEVPVVGAAIVNGRRVSSMNSRFIAWSRRWMSWRYVRTD